jgi:hypothetical protein
LTNVWFYMDFLLVGIGLSLARKAIQQSLLHCTDRVFIFLAIFNIDLLVFVLGHTLEVGPRGDTNQRSRTFGSLKLACAS